jgi:hypothetical protein
MKYELKYVQPGSLVLSSMPAMLFILGLIGGFLTFVVLPNPQLDPMTILQKLMSAGLFALLYMFLMIALLTVVAFLYNFFTQMLGMKGIRVEWEEAPEDEDGSDIPA